MAREFLSRVGLRSTKKSPLKRLSEVGIRKRNSTEGKKLKADIYYETQIIGKPSWGLFWFVFRRLLGRAKTIQAKYLEG